MLKWLLAREEPAFDWLPLRDRRVRGLLHPVEASTRRHRVRAAVHDRRVYERTEKDQMVRLAKHIIIDFGDPSCPPNTRVASSLICEARMALGWSIKEASTRLGYSRSNMLRSIESGQRDAPRQVRLLLLEALWKLAAKQRAMGRAV